MCCAVLNHSVVSDSVTPWTVAHQAPLSMVTLEVRVWDGLPCPPPGDLPNPGTEPRCPTLQPKNTGVGSLFFLQGDLPNPGIEPGSPELQVDSLPAKLPGKPLEKSRIIES